MELEREDGLMVETSEKKGLLFLGDCFFRTGTGKDPFAALPGWFAESAAVVNCETVVLTGEASRPRLPKLIEIQTTDRDVCEGAVKRFDMLSVANNHTLDSGRAGLAQTTAWLEVRGHAVIGQAGKSRADIMVGKRRVAVFACVDFSSRKYRALARPRDIFTEIRRARQSADVVCVCVHWGTEYADYPSPAQRRLAARFAHSGADLVVGHHPHVFQGCENVGPARVYYSLGNANFGTWQNRHSPWSNVGMAVRLDFIEGKPKFSEHFFRIDENRELAPADEKTQRAARARFASLSGDNAAKDWIAWGKNASRVFVAQESEAFSIRLRKGRAIEYLIFLYWLTKPKTAFLLACFLAGRVGKGVVRRRKPTAELEA
ncbi:MAG: CapA family protein [Desulfatibacillaceae bacterium]